MNNKNPWRDMGRQTLGKVRHGPKDQVGMDRVYRSEVRKITGEYSKKTEMRVTEPMEPEKVGFCRTKKVRQEWPPSH